MLSLNNCWLWLKTTYVYHHEAKDASNSELNASNNKEEKRKGEKFPTVNTGR